MGKITILLVDDHKLIRESWTCLRCYFAVQKQIRRYRAYYLKRYGRIPVFKAAVHGGTVVVSEVGKYKSEIAYHGDVLNTTARMLGKCHEMESDLLTSDWVLHQTEMPGYLKTDMMDRFQLKGKQQEIELHSVYLTTDKQSKERRRLRLFRKRTGKPVQ